MWVSKLMRQLKRKRQLPSNIIPYEVARGLLGSRVARNELAEVEKSSLIFWGGHPVCPSCEGHIEIFVGYNYYSGEADSQTCSSCGGTGVMMWMMPSTKHHERNMRKFFEELIPLTEL